jgi:hypothetical protein
MKYVYSNLYVSFHKIIVVIIIITAVDEICGNKRIDFKVHW